MISDCVHLFGTDYNSVSAIDKFTPKKGKDPKVLYVTLQKTRLHRYLLSEVAVAPRLKQELKKKEVEKLLKLILIFNSHETFFLQAHHKEKLFISSLSIPKGGFSF